MASLSDLKREELYQYLKEKEMDSDDIKKFEGLICVYAKFMAAYAASNFCGCPYFYAPASLHYIYRRKIWWTNIDGTEGKEAWEKI